MSVSRSSSLMASTLLPPVPSPIPWFRTDYISYYQPRWTACKSLTTRPFNFRVVAAPTATSKTVRFVRHGEGIHNVLAATRQAAGDTQPPYAPSPENYEKYPHMVDAPLTAKGIGEAKENAEKVRRR